MIHIRLNGDPYDLDEPMTISALLARLGIDGRRVAVEHNLVVLKRAMFEQAMIKEGDEIEVVNFVGGGSNSRLSDSVGLSRTPSDSRT